MEDNRTDSERSIADNFSFGVVILGLLLGATGVVLTSAAIAIGGGVFIGLGLSYFGLKQLLAD